MTDLLTVYLVAWNESVLLPQITKLWRDAFPGVSLILLDNESDDGTPEMARELGWEIRSFSTGNKMNDGVHMEIKRNCWKDCKTEWCFVGDFDEFTGATEHFLRNTDFNIIHHNGYEMFHDKTQLDEVTMGCPSPGYSKISLWKPHCFEDMIIAPGQHSVKPIPKQITDDICWDIHFNNVQVPLYHFKWTSWEYGIERAKTLAARQSATNLMNKWSYHFALSEDVHRQYYEDGMKNRQTVR